MNLVLNDKFKCSSNGDIKHKDLEILAEKLANIAESIYENHEKILDIFIKSPFDTLTEEILIKKGKDKKNYTELEKTVSRLYKTPWPNAHPLMSRVINYGIKYLAVVGDIYSTSQGEQYNITIHSESQGKKHSETIHANNQEKLDHMVL